jgi:DNA-binding transcriptional LysR family regulator
MHKRLIRQSDPAPAWIALAASLHHVPAARFDIRHSRRFSRVHSVSSISFHHAAVCGGLGAGILACAVGDTNPDLVRVGPVQVDPDLMLWVMHRRELKTNARVSAFFRHLRQALMERRSIIAGSSPSSDTSILSELADFSDEGVAPEA